MLGMPGGNCAQVGRRKGDPFIGEPLGSPRGESCPYFGISAQNLTMLEVGGPGGPCCY